MRSKMRVLCTTCALALTAFFIYQSVVVLRPTSDRIARVTAKFTASGGKFDRDIHGNIVSITITGGVGDLDLELIDVCCDTIESVTFSKATISDSLALFKLSALPQLVEVRMLSSTCDVVFPAKSFATLEWLVIWNSEISDTMLLRLRAPELRVLKVSECEISDAFVRSLVNFRGLEEVLLARNANIRDHGIRQLKSLPNLQILHLPGLHITGSAFDAFDLHSKVRFLDLHDTNTNDSACEFITMLRRLEFLSLANTDVTSAGVATLPKLKNLKELLLPASAISVIFCDTIGGMSKLHRVVLDPYNHGSGSTRRLLEEGCDDWAVEYWDNRLVLTRSGQKREESAAQETTQVPAKQGLKQCPPKDSNLQPSD